jgi:mitochondrial fission protein ELM1
VQNKKLTVWILQDGTPGHETKSVGFVDKLGTLCELEIAHHTMRLRLPAVTRPLLTFALRSLPIKIARQWVFWAYGWRAPTELPDLVVGSGGKIAFANAAFAGWKGVRSVFIGSPRKIQPDQLDWLFSTDTSAASPRHRTMPLPPTPYQWPSADERVAARAKFNVQANTQLIAVLLGGDGAGCVYHRDDWIGIAGYIDSLVSKRTALGSELEAGLAPRSETALQAQATATATEATEATKATEPTGTDAGAGSETAIIFSTSRRTSIEAERALQELLEDTPFAKAVWFNHKEERCMADFLAAADGVIVTSDSVSMIAECVAAGFRPIVLEPATAEYADRVRSLIATLAHEDWIQQVKISEVSDALETSNRCKGADSPLNDFWHKAALDVLNDITRSV